MSTTLTNGLKLPDKGSVDWYSDMQNNYTILDGAVGTIAEHTTALAGKAPLVHTHTKSDITDFPAYGTTAGTICEGNDSRLSDARTPVAHTHTKSDVTDLFNSANTWSANNTYSADCIIYNSNSSGSVAGLKLRNSKAEVLPTGNTSSDQAMTFRDKNDVAFGYIRGAVQSSSVAVKIGAYAKDSSNNTVNTELQLLAYTNGNKAVIPSANNSYDLGSSSYQWNNLYANNYYYNGTEFQSKFVTLDTEQLITGLKRLKSGWWRLQAANLKVGAGEQYGRNGYTLVWTDKDDITICDIASYKQSQAAKTYLRLRGGDYYTNGVPDAAGTLVQSELRIGTLADSSRMIECYTDAMYPGDDNTANLGTSSKKWKTLNGINPGDLSLPDYNSNAKLNLTSTFPTPDANGNISYTPTMNGWLYVYFDVSSATINSGSVLIATIKDANMANANCAQMFWRLPPASDLLVFFPVVANKQFIIQINFTGYTLKKALLIPGMGYVA